VLWCPSDGQILGKRSRFGPYPGYAGTIDNPDLTVAYSSYSGCGGTWYPEVLSFGDCFVRYPAPIGGSAHFAAINHAINGIFRYSIPTSIAMISDGTSHTLIYSEKANGAFSTRDSLIRTGANDSACYNWWGDCVSGDTIFSTLYPINAFRKGPLVRDEDDVSWVEGASSFHPGGANFAFADGSVHFLKESISSWPYAATTGRPIGVIDRSGVYTLAPGTQMGVYQMLSTCAGGEVISADQY
jgi:prepilin-type processing-associated H-X9-DG protein